MNKKLIAAAVSAAVVAPVAAQAEMSVYGRVNNAISIDGRGGDSTTDVSGVGSRFGFKASTEIDGGLTAHGHIEFAITSDKETGTAKTTKAGGHDHDYVDTQTGIAEAASTDPTDDHYHSSSLGGISDIRIATVGVSGGFGRVDIGNQWSSYFSTFGTLISPTYSLGWHLYSNVGGGPYRSSNTIKYSNSFGPVSAKLDIRVNESNEGSDVAEKIRGDGFGLGVSFAVTDNITIATAYDVDGREDASADPMGYVTSTADTTPGDALKATLNVSDDVGHDETRLGISTKASYGNFWASLGWQRFERDGVGAIPITGGTYDLDDDGGLTVADSLVTDDYDMMAGTGSKVVSGVIESTDITYPRSDGVNTLFVYGGGSIGDKTSWLIGYSQADDGVPEAKNTLVVGGNDVDVLVRKETDDSSQVTWGVYHNFGGGLRAYYEAAAVDSENKGYDGAVHLLGLRVDF